MKTLKIFIGIVPDSIQEHGGFDMIVADAENETVKKYPLNIGENALVITINDNTVVAFESNGENVKQLVVPDLVMAAAQLEVENNLQNTENNT